MAIEQVPFRSGVFNDQETRRLRDAYRLALQSLAITHVIDERVKSRLADVIITIYMAGGALQRRDVDIGALASRGVERYLTFYNLQRIDQTLH